MIRPRLSRLTNMLRRGDRELDLEIRDHLERSAAEHQRLGLSPDEARVAARRDFGGVEPMKARYRETWSFQWPGDLVRDTRLALRLLRRAPAFAIVTVATLALGIGLNTAVFSIVNTLLLRPLGFANPERLVAVYEGTSTGGPRLSPFSPPDLLDLQREQRVFEATAAYTNLPIEVSGGGDPERLTGARVSASLFQVLGVPPALGRGFTAAEDEPGNTVAVISWELWQRRFGGRPDALGGLLQIDRRAYTVIGVMPAAFQFPRRGPPFNNEPADVWIPLGFTAVERAERGSRFVHSVVARLAPGVTLAGAQAELAVLARRVYDDYPPMVRSAFAGLEFPVRPLTDDIAGETARPLLMLFGAIGLVLLVACANVANLVLSRAAARERETAVRTALGATDGQLLRLRTIEALLLTVSGGALGLAMARWVIDLVPAVVSTRVPGLDQVALDWRVLVYTAGVSTVTALLFGSVPIVARERKVLAEVLREGGRGSAGVRGRRLQSGLVVATVSLAVVLVVAAGLLVRSFAALSATDQGFRPADVLTVELALPRDAYPDASSVRRFHQQLLDRAEGLPGVRSVGLGTDLPLETYEIRVFTPEDGTEEPLMARRTRLSWVHGAYFETLRMTLVAGRVFDAVEHVEPRGVVIINERLAERFWPGRDPIGRRLKWGPPDGPAPWLTVVGVVGDVDGGRLAASLLGESRPIQAYLPFRQFPDAALDSAVNGFGRDIRLAIGSTGDASPLAESLRRELASLDPALAVARMALMEERVSDAVAPQRFSATLLAAFAGGALLLAGIGLYGLLAFTVAQRRRELGVRIALGADARTVIGLVLGEGAALVGTGLVLGLLGALAVARLLTSFLFGIDQYDVVAFAVAPLVLTAVTLLACGLPALRAARVDPLLALRDD